MTENNPDIMVIYDMFRDEMIVITIEEWDQAKPVMLSGLYASAPDCDCEDLK